MRDYLSGSQHGLDPYALIKEFYQAASDLPGILTSKLQSGEGERSLLYSCFISTWNGKDSLLVIDQNGPLEKSLKPDVAYIHIFKNKTKRLQPC